MMVQQLLTTLVLLLARDAVTQHLAPVVIPAVPKPFFSWDTIPTAFHGANTSGVYTDEAVAELAKHCMVTIEKWYTPCASHGNGSPSCFVEKKIERVLGRIKTLRPELTGILYLNTMFNFGFYHLNGLLEEAEAAGKHSFLRDETGKVVSLCNDGNGYCNVTTFDWTKPHVRDLWMEAITNATSTGDIDGIFADHSAQEHIQIGAATNGQELNQLCNGKDQGRTCYNFSANFKESFNSWHLWATNQSQELLSKTTGGPVICGPLATYGHNMCDFDGLRKLQQRVDVIEASRFDQWPPSQDCLAAFLAAAERGTYITRFSRDPAIFNNFTEHARQYPLGEPDGPAVEVEMGVFRRRFGPPQNALAGAKPTEVWWDNNAKRGNLTWGGGQPPPPPPHL